MSHNFILHNIKSYNEPSNTDTCVALCYFNPVGYKNQKENLDIVLDSYKKSNIPYFTIELLYKNEKSYIKDATKTVYAESVIFSKENLWNLLEKSIPDQYSKIIFVDADIKFSNPNWFNLSSEKLNDCDIIQPMDVVYRDIVTKMAKYVEIENESCNYTVAHAIETTGKACEIQNHPGYALGIKRDIFHKINGFFEYGLYGCGDTLFWMAISNFYSTSVGDFLLKQKEIGKKFYEYKINTLDYDLKIGAVFDNLSVHLFHGSRENRNYANRINYLSDIYTKDSFYYNEYGVLEIKNSTDIYQYLLDRSEDS